MITKIAQVALLVRDYDEAIRFYCDVLGFKILEDQKHVSKRWVRIGLSKSDVGIVVTKATDLEQARSIGKQAGGRVYLYLHTDDFDAEYKRLQSAGVTFAEAPRNEPYGKIAVFQDLYGNRIDLIQPT